MTTSTRLASRSAGQGEALVVIQQLDSKELWQPVVDRLTGQREVFAVDLPGFGESPPLLDEVPSTVAALADAVAGWFGVVGLQRPHVVGCSVGGAVALTLAQAGAVRSATAISPVGLWSRAGAAYTARSVGVARRTAQVIDPFARLVVGNPIGRTLTLSQIVARPWRVPGPTAVAALRNMARAPGVEATRHELYAYRLESFDSDVPLTIAWGEKDRLTPLRQARRARELFPQARHVTLRHCGHVPMFDDPGRVADVVLAGTDRFFR